MGTVLVRIFGALTLGCGLVLLLGASLIWGAARTSAANTVRNPAYDYHKVRMMAELRALPSGQQAVIFGHVAEDAPTTTFSIASYRSESKEKHLVPYRLYSRANGEFTLLQEEKPAFDVALADGSVPLVNTDYTISFSYFSWKTVEGPWVSGQEPGGQVTVLGTVETLNGAPAFRATSISDASPDSFTPSAAPTTFDMLNATGLFLATFGFGTLVVGVLILVLPTVLKDKARPSMT